MTELGWIGVWLLVFGAVAIVVELALAVIWTFRMSKRARTLSDRLAAERSLLQTELATLNQAMAETRALWQPYRRLLRWFRHPFVIALIGSYARRRAAAR